MIAAGGYFLDADDHELPNLNLPMAGLPPSRNCAPNTSVRSNLLENHGETLQASMLAPNLQSAFELYANDSTGAWTMTNTSTNGYTCLIAAGSGFNDLNGLKAKLKPNV
jgi:hypothetical protein